MFSSLRLAGASLRFVAGKTLGQINKSGLKLFLLAQSLI